MLSFNLGLSVLLLLESYLWCSNNEHMHKYVHRPSGNVASGKHTRIPNVFMATKVDGISRQTMFRFPYTRSIWAIGSEALRYVTSIIHFTSWEETFNSNSITVLFIWSLKTIFFKKIYETDPTTNSASLKFSNIPHMQLRSEHDYVHSLQILI